MLETSDRRHRRRRRRRRPLQLLTVVAGLAAIVGVGVATHGRGPTEPVLGRRKPVVHRVLLRPPRPIPGYLLIADRGNNRMLLVDSAKRLFWSYPPPAGAAMPFRFDDDTFFGPRYDRIISNQEDQNTIQIISFPAGRVLWRYGHVNRLGSAAGYLHTPDDAYLLRNGLVTVADAYNCRVLFLDRADRIVRQYGSATNCRHAPPTSLGPVNGATPLPDGGTLISEIPGSWIDDIGPNGALRWAVQAPVSYPSDPQLIAPGRILLADYAHPGHALIMGRSGHVLWKYGPSSGPGELDHPSLAFRIAPGLVAINDDYRDRIVIVDIHTNRIIWQYGHTDRPGRAAGFLNTPDGMDLLPTSDAQSSPVIRRLLSVGLRRAHSAVHAPSSVRTTSVEVATLHHGLSTPVQRAVAAPVGSSIVIAGGIDAAGTSANGVFRLVPRTGRLQPLGSVPQPFHDAAGAMIGGRLFIFGGGSNSGTTTVQAFDFATRHGAVVGRLPRPLSDVVAASVAATTYLVGGYDNVSPRPEIYATTDGMHFRAVGRLPHGVRYPAVAAVGNSLVIAGGVDGAGPTADVYVFDCRTDKIRRIGALPQPIAHASAVTLGNAVYIVGGTGPANAPSAEITRIDVAARTVAAAGRTTVLADAAVAGRYLIGGTTNGRAVGTVREVRARR